MGSLIDWFVNQLPDDPEQLYQRVRGDLSTRSAEMGAEGPVDHHHLGWLSYYEVAVEKVPEIRLRLGEMVKRILIEELHQAMDLNRVSNPALIWNICVIQQKAKWPDVDTILILFFGFNMGKDTQLVRTELLRNNVLSSCRLPIGFWENGLQKQEIWIVGTSITALRKDSAEVLFDHLPAIYDALNRNTELGSFDHFICLIKCSYPKQDWLELYRQKQVEGKDHIAWKQLVEKNPP